MAYHKGIPGIGAVTLMPQTTPATGVDIALVTGITTSTKSEDVDLLGSDLDPVDSYEGSRAITGKVELNEFSAALEGAVTAGVTVTDASSTAVSYAATATYVLSGTTQALTSLIPAGGTFVSELAIVNLSDGKACKKVASGPAASEFSISGSTVTHAAADTGDTFFIRFRYSVATGAKQALVKQASLGTSTPKYGLFYFASQGGKNVGLYYPQCRIYNLEQSFKRGAWASGSFDFKALPDASGNIKYTWAAE